jgi:GNAT superfamily N-acetyltransferase
MSDLRPASPSDVPAIARLVAQTPLWQRYGVTVDSARAALEMGLGRGDPIHVAMAEELLGFAWLLPRGGFDRTPYLKWIGVVGGGQGRGVGAQLLNSVEGAARSFRPELMLLCSHFNEGGRRFYLRQGYQQVGVLPAYVLPDVDEVIFWKRLG